MSNKGIFGFLRPENLFVCFFLWGFMCGFWGLCGYVIAMKYFPPVVIMNCLLILPVFGQLIGVFMNIDEPPGPLTYVGVIVVIIAINIVHKGSPPANKIEKEEASPPNKIENEEASPGNKI